MKPLKHITSASQTSGTTIAGAISKWISILLSLGALGTIGLKAFHHDSSKYDYHKYKIGQIGHGSGNHGGGGGQGHDDDHGGGVGGGDDGCIQYSPPAPPQCFAERFNQPAYGRADKLDVLFVVDTSNSMDKEKDAVAGAMVNFIRRLPKNLDINVGVMPAHGSKSKHSGQLYRVADWDHPVLSYSKLGDRRMAVYLATDLKSAPYNSSSAGGEEGLYSFWASLNGAKLAKLQDQGFYRHDAALTVIFLSDENDVCYPDPKKRATQDEIEASQRDCFDGSGNRKISFENIFARVKEVKGDMPFVIGSVVHLDRSSVRGKYDGVGYGYLDLVSLAKGVNVEIALGKLGIADGISRIGAATGQALSLSSDFTISRANINPQSIKVEVDGVAAPFISRVDSTTGLYHVILTGNLGQPLSAIDIDYCMMPTPMPDPIPCPTPTVIVPSPTPTVIVEPSPTPTVIVPSPTPTVIVEPSPTPTVIVEPSPTPTVIVPSPTPTVIVEPSPTPTVVPSPTPTVIVEPSPTPTVIVEPSPTPTVIVEPTPTPTVVPSPTPTVIVEPSPTPTVVPSPTPTVEPSPSPTPTPSPSPCTGFFGFGCGGNIGV